MEKAEDGVPSSSADGQANAFPRMQHLFVMRHGDRLDDADHNWTFKAPRPWDPPITDVGKRRARRAGRTLRHQGLNITRVICSPFLRCVQTASEVIIGLCSLDPSDDDAAEVAIDPSKVKVQCSPLCLIYPSKNLSKKNVVADALSRKPQISAVSIPYHNELDDMREQYANVSIEYGLCEVMNSYAIRVPQMPPTGPTIMELDDLEALLPAGTVDDTVPKLLAKLPDWRETLDASHKRYVETFQAIADMFPGENVLCVTHGEGVSVSVTHHQTVTVYQVRYCAISHLQRPIHNLATPPAAGPFELLTEPGDESGLSFSKRTL
ncbi:hypothetical protein L7F22_023712 [Adiantum nelumboides]|nr:hypothetical protein [Adiantum nelumboides]